MESKILSGVLSTDTHVRLQAGELLLEYLRDESNQLEQYEELDALISGLANWMSSSNFRMSLQAMDLLIMIVLQMKEKFKPFVSSLLSGIREKLGDTKDSVREKTQVLIQQIMQDTVSSPQKFLDTVLEGVLGHKNWRVKEQGLLCISRTLSFFGSGQISVSKYVGVICDLLGDANAQVRSVAIETLVEIYRHVGVKVRIDLSKRNIPAAKLQLILQRFDEVDGKESGDDSGSLSSCSSSASLKTSTVTSGGGVTVGGATTSKKKGLSNGSSGSSAGGSGSGAVDEIQFEKAYTDVPHINLYTRNDQEKIMDSITRVLSNKDSEWDSRVTSLKELRALIQSDANDQQLFLTMLKNLEVPYRDALKDLRSQVVREACVTLSCLVANLGIELLQFVEMMLPYLIALLPNSAKVMSSSANVCVRIIVKNCPHHRLISPVVQGFQAKSAITRKSCAEIIDLFTRSWDTSVLDRGGSVLEEVIVKGIKDADPTARKLMRRAFWGYHAHYPTTADRLFNSFDSQLQKHLRDEKRQLEGTPLPAPVPLSHIKPKLKKSEFIQQQQQLQVADPAASLPPKLGGSVPSIRVRTPTIRSPVNKIKRATEPNLASVTKSLSKTKLSKSSENILADLGAPARPSSRSGVRRTSEDRPTTPSSSRSSRGGGARSPLGTHRDESPVRKSSSMPRRTIAKLTSESLTQISGGYVPSSHGDDDDETGSVNSERSGFSLSSEISISPYATSKYPNPITDLEELVKLCSSKAWSDRRDGIAQLHLLLESDRELTPSDVDLVKNVFKRMFAEPHAKVYSMFLETFTRFIEVNREYIDDWLFFILLRLLHKQGTDMPKSIQFKVQLVLEHVRKAFDTSHQFNVLCRILNDPAQQMSIKIKQSWLEYMHELIPYIDSNDFKETPEIRSAFAKLLSMTLEPKSVDVRKASQRVVTSLFNLNTSVFSLLRRGLTPNLMENADRIIKGYLQEGDASSEEDDAGEATPKASHPFPLSPNSMSRQISSSSPDITSLGYETPTTPLAMTQTTPKATSRSRVPVPSGRNTPSKNATPSRIPRPSSRQGGGGGALPPRARSVDPDRMMATNRIHDPIINYNTTQKRDRYQRPASSQSEYITSSLRNRGGGDSYRSSLLPRPPSSQGFMLDHFISTLPMLDFGSPDPDGEPKDQVALLLKEIKNANNSKLRATALQTIFTLARSYDHNNWKDHIEEAITVLLDCTQDTDGLVRTMSLRVIRELVKARPPGITQFTVQLTNQVLESYHETDCNVSQAAEDMFSPLASAVSPSRVLDILSPIIAKGVNASSLGALKLLSKVVSHCDDTILKGRIHELVPGVVQGYCHEESSIRKASVFCLVEIHSIVGEEIRPLLDTLSSSQAKLLDLYIRRHHSSAKKEPHPASSEH